MALLDLQGMEDEAIRTGAPAGGGSGGRSGASKHCGGGGSGLSLLLC